MHRLRSALFRIVSYFRRNRHERELNDELTHHLDLIEADWVHRGMTPEAARAAARRQFGNIQRVKQDQRDARALPFLDTVVQDGRYAARTLRRNRGLAIVVVATLGLGIGANTTIFSQVHAVFFKTLPVDDAQDLRILSWTPPNRTPGLYNGGRVSYPAYRALVENTAGFSDIACWSGAFSNLGAQSRIETHVVSGNYFRTLGATPLVGRTITPQDERDGAPVTVLSYSAWQREFGGDPSAVGREIRVNGAPVTVVGVMPPGFLGMNPGQGADLYLPLGLYGTVRFEAGTATPRDLEDPDDWGPGGACEMVARLSPGAAEEAARAEAEVLIQRMYPADPSAGAAEAPRLALVDASRGLANLREISLDTFLISGAATGLVLLLICVNVAGLLLSRASARSQEIGTRLALGATRRRLVRQLFTESLMLSMMGAVVGLILLAPLNRVFPGPLTARVSAGVYLGKVAPGIDWSVLVFSFMLSVIAAMLFGLVPAFAASRRDLVSMITPGLSPGGPLRGHALLGKAFIGLQVALAVVVMVPAGLFIQTLGNLRHVPLGFERPETLAFFSVRLGPSGYSGARGIEFFDSAIRRLETVPGVVTVSGASGTGAAAVCPSSIQPGGRGRDPGFRVEVISPGFFETLGVSLLSGREIFPEDRGATRIALVNAAYVREFSEGVDPLGRGLDVCGPGNTQWSIVGTVEDQRTALRQDVRPTIYIPFHQVSPAQSFVQVQFVVRTAGDPTVIMPALRQAMADVDPDMPLFDVETGRTVRARQMESERELANVVIFLGGVALLLACLGIYGVLAHTVKQRTEEVGIRMALGADRAAVVRMIVGESMLPVTAGIVAGAAASPFVTRPIESMLFGVSGFEPGTIGIVAVTFLMTAAVAALIPARRASRIEPVGVLRHE